MIVYIGPQIQTAKATDLPPAYLTLVLILTSHMCKSLTGAANPLSSLAAARQRPTKPDIHTTPEPGQTSSQHLNHHHQNQPFRHAQTRQTRRGLPSRRHSRRNLNHAGTHLITKKKKNISAKPSLELPHGPPHAVHMHLINRARRPSRISRGKQSIPGFFYPFKHEPSFQANINAPV